MARFAALDGLRGVCAIAVALYHLPVAFHLFGSPLVREAYVFVDFFFVLSGFVIAHAYGRRLASGVDLQDFFVRRIGRIWPLHLVTLGAMLLLECILFLLASGGSLDSGPPFAGERDLALLLPNALLVHGWMPLMLSWNAPSWSISAELLAYVVFGLTMVLAQQRAITVAAIILGLTWFVSLSIAPNHYLYASVPGLRGICGFFAGVLVHAAFLKAGRPGWSRAAGTALELAAIALIVAFLFLVSRKEMVPWAMPVFSVAVFVFAAERGAVSAALGSALPQMLGRLSFSIYLTHAVLFATMTTVTRLIAPALDIRLQTAASVLFPGVAGLDWDLVDFGSFWINDAFALAVIASVVGVSAVTWRVVEMPGQLPFAGVALRLRRVRGKVTAAPAP